MGAKKFRGADSVALLLEFFEFFAVKLDSRAELGTLMRLHFKEYGQGAPLVILHGLLGSLDNWQPISRVLASSFHVLAVDQRNHGRSPHSEEMSYSLMAEDLAGFFRDHSIESGHVLGHSMGGKTAMQFALSFPELVRRLIVVDVAPGTNRGHGAILRALRALPLGSFHSRAEVESALAGSVPKLSERRFLLKNLRRGERGAFSWKIPLESIERNEPRLRAAIAAAKPVWMPALFIRGGRSDYIQDGDIAEIRRWFPGAVFRTIPEAGHWVHAEAPGQFVEIAREFLEKQE
jgi:esterase